jgi:hypothetical protein
MMNTAIYLTEFNISSADVNSDATSSNVMATEKINLLNVSGVDSFMTHVTGVQQSDPPTSGTLSPLSQPSDSDYIEIPVVGLPGEVFTIIHGAALFSISTSILVSISLLIVLCACRKKKKRHRNLQSEDPRTSQSTLNGPSRQAVANNRAVGSDGTRSKSDAYKIETSIDDSDDNSRKMATTRMKQVER